MSNFVDTDYNLFRRLVSDDPEATEEAWNRFVDLYRSAMIEFVQARGGGDDSEDVVQDVFRVLVKSLKEGGYKRRKGGSFHGYLIVLLKNTLANYFKRNSRWQRNSSLMCFQELLKENEESTFQTDEEWDRAVRQSAIAHILNRKTIRQETRDIYRAVVLDLRPMADVCHQYGLSEKQIIRICRRVELRIREVEKVLHEAER